MHGCWKFADILHVRAVKPHHLVGIAIAVVCAAAAVFLFDWREIGTTLHRMRLDIMVGGGLVALLAASWLRGLRWLAVVGARMTLPNITRSSLVNGAASGLSAVTPMQLGEAIKIRHLPSLGLVRDWKFGLSAFFVERMLDLAAVVGFLLFGLAAHSGIGWAALLLLGTPLAAALVLTCLASYVDRLPARLRPYLEAFRHRKRIYLASTMTIVIWACHALLWWCAAEALGVRLGFPDVSMLIGGMMLATAASMAPGGLGVAELGTRGMMLWLGFTVSEAEATAIGLRLLTPLVALFGLACFACLSWGRKAAD